MAVSSVQAQNTSVLVGVLSSYQTGPKLLLPAPKPGPRLPTSTPQPTYKAGYATETKQVRRK